jgi:hypothetical protein
VPDGARMKMFKTVQVLNLDGSTLLYDMYVDNEWIGSRRTLEQCEEVFRELAHHGDARESGAASRTAQPLQTVTAESDPLVTAQNQKPDPQ